MYSVLESLEDWENCTASENTNNNNNNNNNNSGQSSSEPALDEEHLVFLGSVFQRIDKNDNGTLEQEEMIIEFLTADPGIPAALIQEVINRSDKNRDGKIDRKEFVDMVCKHTKLFTKYFRRYMMLFKPPRGRNRKFSLQRVATLTGSYEDLIMMKKSTLGMIILSILQVLLFYSGWKEWLIFNQESHHQIWRYVSYMFTHNSLAHVLINVAVQLLVGLPLEMVNGWIVLVIYCAGTLGGCLFQSVIYPSESLAGASPGVYAILTAHVAKIVLNFREVNSPIPQLITFGIFTCLDTIYNYFTYWNYHNVSYIAHLGGAICGLLMGIVLLKNIKERPHEVVIWWIALVLYVVLMVALVVLDTILPLK